MLTKILIYGDIYFSTDMAWGFGQLGHDVKLIAPRTAWEMDALLADESPDLLFTLGSPAYFNTTLLDQLGHRPQSQMKCIHWDTDGITWLDIEMRHINLLKPDLVFTVCPDMLKYLRSKGIPCEMLFYAFCPILHHTGPVASTSEGQITFVAGAYPQIYQKYPKHLRRISMNTLIQPLLADGYKVDFYGDNRHKQVIKSLYNLDVPDSWLHGRCPYEQTWQIYNSCSINLVAQNHENGLTKRTFEILGSGGFALSYDNVAIKDYFTPGTDLVVSSSPEQTLELVNYYSDSNHADEYKKIRENAIISAQKHTYKQRADEIISKLAQIDISMT